MVMEANEQQLRYKDFTPEEVAQDAALFEDLNPDEASSLNGGRYCRYLYIRRRYCTWYGCYYRWALVYRCYY
jgi:hypothetical protein